MAVRRHNSDMEVGFRTRLPQVLVIPGPSGTAAGQGPSRYKDQGAATVFELCPCRQLKQDGLLRKQGNSVTEERIFGSAETFHHFQQTISVRGKGKEKFQKGGSISFLVVNASQGFVQQITEGHSNILFITLKPPHAQTKAFVWGQTENVVQPD